MTKTKLCLILLSVVYAGWGGWLVQGIATRAEQDRKDLLAETQRLADGIESIRDIILKPRTDSVTVSISSMPVVVFASAESPVQPAPRKLRAKATDSELLSNLLKDIN